MRARNRSSSLKQLSRREYSLKYSAGSRLPGRLYRTSSVPLRGEQRHKSCMPFAFRHANLSIPREPFNFKQQQHHRRAVTTPAAEMSRTHVRVSSLAHCCTSDKSSRESQSKLADETLDIATNFCRRVRFNYKCLHIAIDTAMFMNREA